VRGAIRPPGAALTVGSRGAPGVPHRHRSRRLNVFIEWFAELIKPHLEA